MSMVHGASHIHEASLTVDTSAYASGDTLGTLITIDDCLSDTNGTATIMDITVVDNAGQDVEIGFYFYNASVTLASDNAAYTVSDADANKCVGYVSVSDYVTGGTSKSIGQKRNVGLQVYSDGTTRNVYCGLIILGAPTYTASDLTIKFKFLQDL